MKVPVEDGAVSDSDREGCSEAEPEMVEKESDPEVCSEIWVAVPDSCDVPCDG